MTRNYLIGFLFFYCLSFNQAVASFPDLSRNYQYREAVFQSLADEIINSAIRQDKILYRNDVLNTIQIQLNPVFDNIVINSEKYSVCSSADLDCISEQFNKVESYAIKKIENRFFDFYNYQNQVWTKIYIAPKRGWSFLNEWYPSFINIHFGLDADSLYEQQTNEFYLNTRVMFYRLKEDVFPEERHVSKSLFSAYYNHCVHVLENPSIISYEFFEKMTLVDSLMDIASTVNTGDPHTPEDIANVYIALAFNDNFPGGVTKEELFNVYFAADHMLKKALSIHESGKVHYGLGALYNNFLVDYENLLSSEEKLDAFSKHIIPSFIDEESTDHLDRACQLDPEYCNLRKFKDKTR